MAEGIWISWEIQRRNKELASRLGWPLYEVNIIAPRISRYIQSLATTVSIVLKEKPSVVVAQNPSIVLAIWMCILSLFFRFSFVMDAHNGGINPQEQKVPILMSIATWLIRRATFTIVTNAALNHIVKKRGGRGIVLPDALPHIEKHEKVFLDGSFRVAFICTYSADEPYAEVIKAASLLPPTFKIYITGKFKNKVDPLNIPSTVTLLGFVPDKSFFELLISADVIMDLTTREDCLVCGAYEGVALHQPLILSNTIALRHYFYKGCTYVDPTADSIAKGIVDAHKNLTTLRSDIALLEGEIEQKWASDFEVFKQKITPLINKRSTRKFL